MRMNAIPLSAGMAEKNFLNAPNPPAEAPIPTIGNGVADVDGSGKGCSAGGCCTSSVTSGGERFLLCAATAVSFTCSHWLREMPNLCQAITSDVIFIQERNMNSAEFHVTA